ncbi:GntR family transcriptional regulator [Sporosarcina sp. P3]|uniref:aminotransferase-like domain-containing protein n=1 Tax=Sporosarcina sp. P3 TaxID=2048245 RepID=UPI000C171A02|nr:PLP-dependent aminotransferase family protein [Sporosarcina sp. P3]PID21800.1 GntR family transcriptional regulator [Sporosarcina sp. P3]
MTVEEDQMRKPKYIQIVEYIKEKIAKGEWAIGDRIPSQRALAKLFDVNRSTVISALDELTADGLIEGKSGKGTVVIHNTWTLMGHTSSTNWNENIALGIHKASMETVQKINEAESENDLIQLSKGELSPDIFPLKKMRSVVRKVSDRLEPFGYEVPKGNLQLRQAISEYLKKAGIHASPSSILVVSGALQALHLISIGLLQKGSTVFLEKPSYLYSLSMFQSMGMDLKGLPMDGEGLVLSSIYQPKSKNSVLYTIPTFHNPTGKLMQEKRREELIQFCVKEQLPVIEDDVYRELWIDSPPPAPLKANDHHGNILYLGSLSKSLSPGLRIGWVVGSESVIDRLADLKMQSDYGSSTLSQQVAAEWLSSGLYEDHLLFVREQLKIRRGTALGALETYLSPYATWEIPKGGFFIWIKIKPAFQLRNLFQKALAKGILLNPGSIYAEQSGQSIRLSYAYASLEEINEGIFRLGEMIKNRE